MLNSPQEEEYDNIAALVAFISGCSTGHVSIIGDNVQWLKAKVGFGEKETPRNHAFCAHAIVHDDIMVVEDATLDERFVNNPLVTGPQHLRFYAGVPIYGPSGHPIGTICALDIKPKVLSEAQKTALKTVAHQASKLLELRKRNIELAAAAAEQLHLERKTLNRQLAQQEAEREKIGYELHENFCQVLAASLHHLAAISGLTKEQVAAMQGVKAMITTLLQNMRAFSTNIHPVGQLAVGMKDKLMQLLGEYEELSGLTIDFHCTGELDTVQLNNINHLFRIILEWLTVYEQNGPKQQAIQVCLEIDKEAILGIGQPGAALPETIQSSVIFNSIRKRCEMIQGAAVLLKTAGNSQMVVSIPLT
ncbi:hypothetical protein BUE76_01025 [Cnuella takakiae]|nr:hypothetical protein BUE76_01025 [Cnuella takakiae]